MKIHISGGSGSGKTYAASILSKKLALPHYDLDDLFWDHTSTYYGKRTDPILRDQKLKSIVQQDKWIIEGVYLSWAAPSFSAANKIIVLIPALSVQEKRIWERYEQRKSYETGKHKRETYESIQELITWNKNYNKKFLPDFLNYNLYQEKIAVFENNDDVIRTFL
ncbi:P-loop NTPase family protein [Evansella halocellulosilytica]|uniref:DNA topology modulation protein FlaR n=1 Tax=Evansella halocellulosilytica TaxID=2011013 RepID=UPI000BB92050|nr:DNA topology modulation protein FlaR [Evansella halocellulosilytica]